MARPSIDIIIPTFDRKSFLELILRTLYQRTDRPYRIIIVMHPSKDDTEAFLENNKYLYSVLIKTEKKLRLVETFNIGLEQVQSEDVVVTNDDVLIYNYHWLGDLYKAYKTRTTGRKKKPCDWFGMLPFIVPFKNETRECCKAEDKVIYWDRAFCSYYRMQNTKKIRDVGGFKAVKRGRRDHEAGGFSNISAQYGETIGCYLKLRAIDLRYLQHRHSEEFFDNIVHHFLEKGKLPDEDSYSN